MARKTVITCDRCGKELPPECILKYKQRVFSIDSESLFGYTIKKIELCQNCKKSFMKWIKQEE